MRLLLGILLLLCSIPVLSQDGPVGIDPEKPLSTLSQDRWTSRNGLISNNLTSVFQSSEHFIWLTSFNGILRFDGVNFKLYDKHNLPFLNSNGFYKSYQDSQNNLWFTSQSSGIIKYTNQEFKQVLTAEQSSLSVRCVQEDNEGMLWVGTNNDGVYLLEDTILRKVDFGDFNDAYVMDIEIDDKGNIWFGTNGYGILIYNNGEVRQVSTQQGLNHRTVSKLLFSKSGVMYAGTLNGIFMFEDDQFEQIRVFDGLEINDMYIDDFNNLWVGAEQGLYKFHLDTKIFDSFTEKDGLPASQVSSLCFDHENNLWISTKKAGLIRFRDGYFKNITTKDGLSSNNVNIVVANGPRMYVGCDDGLLNVVEGNVINLFRFRSSSYNIGIRDVNFGPGGEVLVASYQGLIKIKNGEETHIDLTQYGAGNDIRRIYRSRDGVIWLATRSSGVVKYVSADQVKIFDSSNSLKANYILALEEDRFGNMYIGTHSGGLSVIDTAGNVNNYPIEEGKSGILIFNIHLMDDGSAWMATNIGLYKFENQVFKKVVLDDNLKAETVFDVVVDNGIAWMSSNIGLLMVELENLEDFVDGDTPFARGRLLDRYDGMASQECTGATRMTLDNEGFLWVPTLGGVAVLDPENVEENEQIPEVYVTDLVTDFSDRNLTHGKELVIEPGVLRYEFKFTSLSFVAPPKVQFKYRLEGIDQDWVEAGTEREAIYTNLPKGNFTFRVIATNNDGLWNEEGASIKFRVEPYFYETTLFIVGMIVLVGVLIWGIFVWRLHNIERVNTKLLKLNAELDRFVYSASHDLRAPLSSVLGLVEIARLESTIQRKDECLAMINTSIKKLDGFINDIIDYSRNQRLEIQVEKVDMEREVSDVFDDLKYLDKENKIEKKVDVQEQKEFMTDGRRVSVILKNLVSNSIRYHDLEKSDPYIHVDVQFNSHNAQLTIADNGIGIDEKHLENIFKMFYRADEGSKGSGLGLYIVKETVDKLGGKIEVESTSGRGTSFIITIPSLSAN